MDLVPDLCSRKRSEKFKEISRVQGRTDGEHKKDENKNQYRGGKL